MSKDARDFLLVWLAIFGIAVLYRYGQNIAYHEAVTWHNIGNSMLKGSPAALLILTNSRLLPSALSQYGWKRPEARATSLRLVTLLMLCLMAAHSILVISFLFERPEQLAVAGLILAAMTVVFAISHVWADRLLGQRTQVASTPLLHAQPVVNSATEETTQCASYAQEVQSQEVILQRH